MMMNSSALRQVQGSRFPFRIFIAGLMAYVSVFAANYALAQDERDIGILVIDMQKVQRDAAASVSVAAQIAELRDELEAIIAERSQEISREETELADERGQLTIEELRTRARAFERKVFAHRDFEQQETAKLQLLQAKAREAIRGRMLPILAEIMREQRAEIMLDKTQVVLSKDTLDVTEEVLRRLNEAMPKLVISPQRDPG